MAPKRRSRAGAASGAASKKQKQTTLTPAGRVQPPGRPRVASAPPSDEDNLESQDADGAGGGGDGEERGRDGEGSLNNGERAGDDGAVDADAEGDDLDAPKGKQVPKRPPAGCYASGCWEWVKNATTRDFVRGADGKKQVVCRICQDRANAG